MKKLLISLSMCLLIVSAVKAQVPFQMHYETTDAVNGDHYSIEAAKEGGPYAYACAGTNFLTGLPAERFHVFTLNAAGDIQWEKYLDVAKGRILDVTIDEEFNVAVTGYVDNSGHNELYFALYDGNTGDLIGDMTYDSYDMTGKSSAGNNIFYSQATESFIIGGTQYDNSTNSLQGNAIYMSVDISSFMPNWVRNVDLSCTNSPMSSINHITAVNDLIYMTGNIALDFNWPSYNGTQLLGLLIDPSSGNVQQNLSFFTGHETGSETMGVSAIFDEETQKLHLMYNRSVGLITSDQTKPYFLTYKWVGGSQPLVAFSGMNAKTILTTPPTGFSNDPNITGLTLVPNRYNDNYFFTGILEQAGSNNFGVMSFFQEIDLTNNQLVGHARYINNSSIPNGYPLQGGLFSFHTNNFSLNSDVFTPENATVSSDGKYLVSIIPSQSTASNTYTFDVSSTNMNVAGINSADCIGNFRLDFINNHVLDEICLETEEVSPEFSNPQFELEDGVTSFDINCDYFSKPSRSKEDISIHSETNFKIYPNPAYEILNFDISKEGSYTIEITYLNGQKVFATEMTEENSINRIDISNLHPGIYFFKASSSDGTFEIEKFIKE